MSWSEYPELLKKRLEADEIRKARKRAARAEYMRKYRKDNAERIRAQERERYANISRNTIYFKSEEEQ